MVLQFNPYPALPQEEQQQPNEGLQLLDRATQFAQMYQQHKLQQQQLAAAQDKSDVDIATAAADRGDDFWANYAAIRKQRGRSGAGIQPAMTAQAPGAMPTPMGQQPSPMGAPSPSPAPVAGQQMASAGMSDTSTTMTAPQAAPAFKSSLDITPEYLAGIRKQKGSKGLKEYEDTQGFLTNQRQANAQIGQIGFQNAGTLRDDFNKSTANFQVVSENMGNLQRLSKGAGTPADDIALMASYMKVTNPNARIQEGQYARLEDTAGIPDKVRNLYNDLVAGRSIKSLTPQQRQQFIGAAANIYQGQAERHKGIEEAFTGMATRHQLDPQDVITPYGLKDFNASAYQTPPAPEGGGGALPARTPTAAPRTNPAIQSQIAAAQTWLQQNPTSPKAAAVKARLQSMQRGG